MTEIRRPPARIVVVVPARDEEDRIEACLSALAQARQELLGHHPAVRCEVLVVADRCTDRTELLAQRSGFRTLRTSDGSVGAARAAGITALLSESPPTPLSETWVACTDADSEVPTSWLVGQLDHAAAGADLLLGTVIPTGLALSGLRAWSRHYHNSDGHPHVHGANLGVRADIYCQVGGFAPVAEHEDVRLAAAVRRAGGTVVRTGSLAVLTSGRLTGRTPGGVAGYLRTLRPESIESEPVA